ncbi:DUF6879 family protein [Streptomyces sp. MS1.AVA.3]
MGTALVPLVAQGRPLTRTEPHSRYFGWEHSLTSLNIEAGEDIHICRATP